ncbi:MAG: hypothetical protein PHE86_07645 [Candidatus Marinimicrobia bacterium]|nr:hypothetical protein [Candidatus Neomarinimicrobiota bacterium]MDD5583259.1 hypothetical protein [Candidatus Neomarinimicrobiota bacterium]
MVTEPKFLMQMAKKSLVGKWDIAVIAVFLCFLILTGLQVIPDIDLLIFVIIGASLLLDPQFFHCPFREIKILI